MAEKKEPEEKEEEIKAPEEPEAPPSPLEAVLDGEEIPEKFKGKTPKQIMDEFKDLEQTASRKDQEIERLQQVKPPETPPPSEKEKRGLTEEEWEALLLKNPGLAVDQRVQQRMASEFQQRVNPLIGPVIHGRIVEEKRRAEAEPDWKEYKDEVERFMSQVPVGQQIQPNSWLATLQFVRGRRLGEKTRETELQEKMGAGAEKPTPKSPAAGPSKKTLTPEQAKAAAGLGFTEEDYIKILEEEGVL